MEANVYLKIFRKDTSAERKPINEIIALLAAKPNEVFRQGEKIKYRPSRLQEQDCLSYRIEKIICSFVEEEIDSLVDAVISIKPVLDKEMPNYECEFSVALYTEGQVNPEIVITPATVVKLSSLNAKIWVDIYCTTNDDGKWDGDEQ